MLRFVSRLPVLVPIMISFLLGSVECRAQCATPETSSPPTLPGNTPVQLGLTKTLYSKDTKPGQPVEFEVVGNVEVNGQVVIPGGAAVHGSIREINQTGKGPAKVLIDLDPTQTITGEMVRLIGPGTTTDDANLGRPRVKDVGGMVAYGPETIPLLPVVVPVLAVMQLFPGKKVLLHKDMSAVAHVAENVALDAAKLKAAQAQLRGPFAANCRTEACRMGVLASSARVVLGAVSRADCLQKAGDLDGAIEVYQQALALEPDSDYLHFLIAKLFQEKGDLVHALPEYGRGAQLYDEPTRENFANLLEDSGDLDAALAEVKEAILIWPDNAYFHYLLGRLLVKKNDPDAAIVELQWALKKEYNHFSLANCALGRALELKGDLQAALGQYRTAFRAHTHDDRCRAAYERLRLQLKK